MTKSAIDQTQYDSALKRNLDELNNAISKRRALIGLHNAKSAHSLDFFTISAHALYNDIISHTIRVFENGSRAASFWYIVRTDHKSAEAIATQRSIDIKRLKKLSHGFKHIRNKTHFHIDFQAVMDPRHVWKTAIIVVVVWKVLRLLRNPFLW